MTLVCKKCGKKDIENEASNAPRGGFLCRSCFRSLQLKIAGCSVVIGLVVAALAVIGVVFTFVLRLSSG